jgi:hypothetical protein
MKIAMKQKKKKEEENLSWDIWEFEGHVCSKKNWPQFQLLEMNHHDDLCKA